MGAPQALGFFVKLLYDGVCGAVPNTPLSLILRGFQCSLIALPLLVPTIKYMID
jgi:hypothetical protein